MKILHDVKDFFVDLGKDITNVTTKKMDAKVRNDLISSIFLRVIGLLTITLAASTLISGLAVAAGPLAVASVIAVSATILAIGHDILTVGSNVGSLARDFKNIDKGLMNVKAYVGFGSVIKKAWEEGTTGIPDGYKGTLLLAPLYKALNRRS